MFVLCDLLRVFGDMVKLVARLHMNKRITEEQLVKGVLSGSCES